MKTIKLWLPALLTFISLTGFSQIGIGVQDFVTGSGHGSTYGPVLSYSYNRNTVTFGLNIQKEKKNMSGMNASYKYTVEDDNDVVEIYLDFNIIYNRDAFLSKRIKSIFAMNEQDVSSIQLNTIEQYLGFGTKLHFLNNLYADLGIGIGSYETLDKGNYPIDFQYASLRSQNNMSLLLKAGLGCTIK